MLTVSTYLAPSAIDGLGVFALGTSHLAGTHCERREALV